MEELHNFDQESQQQHNPEKQQETISKDFDRTLNDLESQNYSLIDIQELVDSLSIDNPEFKAELVSFQEINTSRLQDILKSYASQNTECSKEDVQLLDYFGIDTNDFMELKESLNILWLDITDTLNAFQEQLDSMEGVSDDFKEKIKASIWIKVNSLTEIIFSMQDSEDFVNNRWIINDKVQEELGFINKELFPSLEAYSQIKAGADIPEKYTIQFLWEGTLKDGTKYQNPEYVNIASKMEEVEELLQATVDSDWDFKEAPLWLYTQDIFDMWEASENALLTELGVQTQEINLLSPEDIKIEEQAMLYFYAMIALQVTWEIVGWPIWMATGAAIDLHDVFNDEETLLQIVQAAWLADSQFKMEKTWVDNVLAWVGLVPWGTQLIKGSKLAEYMSKVDSKTFEHAKEQIKSKLGIVEKGKEFSPEEVVLLEKAESLLWRKLENNQKSAIIEAVNTSENKISIMKNNWIEDSWDLLRLSDEVVWWEVWTLLSDKKYDFFGKQEYHELRRIFIENLDRDIHLSDRLWEWQNALILKHPTKEGSVIKVAKDGKTDDLMQEFHSHEEFYITLEQWKIEYPWQLSNNVLIPNVSRWKWENPVYFQMDRVDGQSFRSMFYREKYSSELAKNYSDEVLDSMSDIEIEHSVYDLWLDTIPSMIMPWDHFGKALYNESQSFMWDRIRDKNTSQETELWNVLSFLDWKWLRHTDMHAWNFMQNTEGRTYIIDFWNVNIK